MIRGVMTKKNVPAFSRTFLKMGLIMFVFGAVSLLVAAFFSLACAVVPTQVKHKVVVDYGKLPLSFEPNVGQTDSQVKFLSRGNGYTLFLTSNEAMLVLGSSSSNPTFNNPKPSSKNESATRIQTEVVRIGVVGANPKTQLFGLEKQSATSNYLIGKDKENWLTKVPNFAKVKYQNIYSGIDLVYYGNQRRVEFDFIVSPGTDPNRIALNIGGAENLTIDADGDLALKTAAGEIVLRKPLVYQELGNERKDIEGRYAIEESGLVRFKVAKYDSAKPLVIDPLLEYSTFLGGSELVEGNLQPWERGWDIAVDNSGSAYITGATNATDFPTTPGAPQQELATTIDHPYEFDAFVTKLSPDGTTLVYSTYLGGQYREIGHSIAVDDTGHAYVAGNSRSDDFPTTVGAYQENNNGPTSAGSPGGDGFVAKLVPDGSNFDYCTLLGGGGDEHTWGIAVDGSGYAYIVGRTQSGNYPVLNPLDGHTTILGRWDAYVTKLSREGTFLVYSTFLGGDEFETGEDIAVGPSGDAYITGHTASDNFPVVNAVQATHTMWNDAFVSKLSFDEGTEELTLAYSTYLGGSESDEGRAIAVDGAGHAYVTGMTNSDDFKTQNPLYTHQGNEDAFVAKFSPDGSSLVYSTYLGGSSIERGRGIAADDAGNAYVTGETQSNDFPLQDQIYGRRGAWDTFLTKLDPLGSALLFSTYIGGTGSDEGWSLALDSDGSAYITGETNSENYPTTDGAYDIDLAATGPDAFVTKVSLVDDSQGPLVTAVAADPVQFGQQATISATIDDTDTGNSNIAFAYYSLDDLTWHEMDAVAPPFDNPIEDVIQTFIAPTEVGVYDVCVYGEDEWANEGLPECALLAVYDPSAGFVTGGGWIDSPEGAYKVDPSLMGKANFGFVAKYDKKTKLPKGNTEFVFETGDLDFHSQNYEWLVVNQGGSNAQFKGQGTINDIGEYKFMLWAGDGDAQDPVEEDTFRIKIWWEDGDVENVIYDNGFDQEIGGGSIVIHTKKK